MDQESETYCADCGVERLGPGIEGASGTSTPCPNCGATGLQRRVFLTDTVHMRDGLAGRSRGLRDGVRKDLQKWKQGTELYRKEGRWHEVRRLIDHLNDWYDEVITDEQTGQVVHECHEPLSQHRGHGGARRDPQRSEGTRRVAGEAGP